MAQKLRDKIVVVTGAGQGMGQAIAERCAAEGAKVVAVDLNLAPVEAVVDGLPTESLAVACNVGDSAAVASMFAEVESRFGGVDVLVNNAGIGSAPGDGFDLYQQRLAERTEQLMAGQAPTVFADHIIDMGDSGWQGVMDVNINGVFYCCREAVRSMIASGHRGSIINISSCSAQTGEGAVHYCASKAAVLGLTRALAQELGAREIRVNAICPGPTNTPMMQEISEEWANSLKQQIPLGRLGEPEEIAQAVLFLASDDGSFFTGQTLMPNGGFIM